MELRPRVVSVGMSAEVGGCSVDYGWKHLVACGCFSTILILDPISAKSIQSLQGHKHAISSVTWAPENYYHDKKNPYILRLASADVNGSIIVWDVVSSTIVSEFSESGCSVLDLQWLQNQNVSRDLLLALHSKGRFILWNTQTQIQLWKASLGETITSWSTDPYNFKNMIFHGKQTLMLCKNFSFSSPWAQKDIEMIDLMDLVTGNLTGTSAISSRGSLRGKSSRRMLTEISGSTIHGSSPNSTESSSSPQEPANALECLQMCYHGYRKECLVLLFPRKFVVFSLHVMTPVATVHVDRSVTSFLRIYACRQRDVLICLHENGALSVYARQGLACPIKASPTLAAGRSSTTTTASATTAAIGQQYDPAEGVGELYDYDLVAFAEGSRRLRHVAPIRFTVNRLREVSIAVTSMEGKIQFWQLRALPLQVAGSSHCASQDPPLWTLSDLLPHEPGLVRPRKLCLQMRSVYMASKPDPTVCRVCPQELLRPVANHLGCQSLVAVGNARGGVQIWDMHSGMLWREFQLLSVPVLGIEWFHMTPQQPSSPNPVVAGPHPVASNSVHLALIVYGWQSGGKHTKLSAAAAAATTNASSGDRTGVGNGGRLEGRNYVLLVDLVTGYTQNLRSQTTENLTEGAMRTGGLVSGSVAHRATTTAGSHNALEGPVELARISHAGQFLALLINGQSVELWKLADFTLITRMPFTTEMQIVALDWYQSTSRSREVYSPTGQIHPASLQLQDTGCATGSAFDLSSSVDRPGTRSGHVLQRESLIMCTSNGTLRLVVVHGKEVDSTMISNSILQGLPLVSLERITAVAWFADLIAFGTADGFVALRDLHNKRTVIRFNSGGGWHSYAESGSVPVDSASEHAVNALSAASRHSTGVRRLAFLPGPAAYTRLLVVLHDSLFVWQPREMFLICMARFGEQLQRCLISADWAQPITGPSDTVFCLIVGADGALRLAQTGESGSEMTIITPNSPTQGAQLNAEQPMTKFFGSSAMPDRLDGRDPTLVPSLLPMKTALIIRHLLQHQPWRQSENLKVVDELAGDDSTTPDTELTNENTPVETDQSSALPIEPDFVLSCPSLAPGFAKVQLAASQFFRGLEQRQDFVKAFCRPTTTVTERCLWTARLFGDAYETRFWHMAAHNLTPADSPNHWRYALDLSWDLLAEQDVFRRSILGRLRLLEQRRTSATHNKHCVRSLMLLGEHERAVSLLMETSPDSPFYNVNMHKACLLAANASGRLRPSTGPASTQVVEDTYMSTVKLVATNLLSNGQIDEGIELLCLIGLYADACRYLESFDQWEQSIWLAKCMLPKDEMHKVLRRWATHLASPQVNRKDFALLLYVFLGDHESVLKLLSNLNQFQLAARYLEACLQAKAITWTKDSEPQYRMIFLEFCKILIELGHHQSASYYCRLAGDLGGNLQNEINFLLS